jgi:hypothetical protein
MTPVVNEDLRYPVGTFVMPTEGTASGLAEWRKNLAEPPAKLHAAPHPPGLGRGHADDQALSEAKWAELPDASAPPVAPSLEIIDGVHARQLALVNALTPRQWQRSFEHPEHGRAMTIALTAALYSWHGRHHVAHITGRRARRGS